MEFSIRFRDGSAYGNVMLVNTGTLPRRLRELRTDESADMIGLSLPRNGRGVAPVVAPVTTGCNVVRFDGMGRCAPGKPVNSVLTSFAAIGAPQNTRGPGLQANS
ncbi:hypothetical protein AUR04nite_09220 [Glutamicibacter uratoxydans]|uniref:Uncharacterized protein n=1 Tax=Glutamicibacter uratoxydans TaxID=43667 RepID=A0A4Y4DP62_GLUUR|nr:hypothetical protein AUR04nite_09220 [Glutamicibacter uratoxydans]